MTIATTQRITPWAMFFWVMPMKIARITAANAARLSELRQVGSLSKRFSRRGRADACFVAGVLFDLTARPVRPGVSIVPAWVPRCLLRRFFLVWAIGEL